MCARTKLRAHSKQTTMFTRCARARATKQSDENFKRKCSHAKCLNASLRCIKNTKNRPNMQILKSKVRNKLSSVNVFFLQANGNAEATAADDTRLKLGAFSVRAIPAPCLVDFRERVEVGEAQRFRLTNLTEKSRAELMVLDPNGASISVEPQSRVGASNSYTLTPTSVGLHSVNVFVDKRHIRGSPFAMHATQSAAARALVWGRGVCARGPRVGDQLPVNVDGCERPVVVEVRNKGETTLQKDVQRTLFCIARWPRRHESASSRFASAKNVYLRSARRRRSHGQRDERRPASRRESIRGERLQRIVWL